jgi:transcriptional regulator with XRE-family HTH domain
VTRFLTGIGAALAYLREKSGLSQHGLAAAIQRKIQPRISEMERGKFGPSSKLINEYLVHCDADEIDLADAFLGPDPPEDELVRRALRTLRVGDLPPRLEKLALEQLQAQRRSLLEWTAADSSDED